MQKSDILFWIYNSGLYDLLLKKSHFQFYISTNMDNNNIQFVKAKYFIQIFQIQYKDVSKNLLN